MCNSSAETHLYANIESCEYIIPNPSSGCYHKQWHHIFLSCILFQSESRWEAIHMIKGSNERTRE